MNALNCRKRHPMTNDFIAECRKIKIHVNVKQTQCYFENKGTLSLQRIYRLANGTDTADVCNLKQVKTTWIHLKLCNCLRCAFLAKRLHDQAIFFKVKWNYKTEIELLSFLFGILFVDATRANKAKKKSSNFNNFVQSIIKKSDNNSDREELDRSEWTSFVNVLRARRIANRKRNFRLRSKATSNKLIKYFLSISLQLLQFISIEWF